MPRGTARQILDLPINGSMLLFGSLGSDEAKRKGWDLLSQALVTLDGADVAPAEAHSVERLCVVFDGMDEAAVVRARDQWRGLTGAGVAAEYWSRESGRWECRAKHPK